MKIGVMIHDKMIEFPITNISVFRGKLIIEMEYNFNGKAFNYLLDAYNHNGRVSIKAEAGKQSIKGMYEIDQLLILQPATQKIFVEITFIPIPQKGGEA